MFTPVEPVKEINIGTEENPKMIKVGTIMDEKREDSLTKLLKEYADVFAWKLGDMPGIDPKIIQHELRIKPGTPPFRQKIRKVAPEYHKAVEKELRKLLEAGFIKEVKYPTWISNMVVVPKKNGGVRICIDFTNLIKACPKDNYPLPSIDQLVEAVEGYEELSFMDGYSGYNQVALAEEDQLHTAFYTPHGLYYYTKMPFGLRNAGATYQRMVDAIFRPWIGSTLEIYVDDMLVKSRLPKDHHQDVRDIFEQHTTSPSLLH